MGFNMYKIGDCLEYTSNSINGWTKDKSYKIESIENNNAYIIFNDLGQNLSLFDDYIDKWFKLVGKSENRNQEQRQSGGSTHYYELPKNATELKDLIRYKKMSHPIGEIFCSIYRLHDNGEYKRNLQKAKFYIDSELEYLEKEEKEIRC